MVLAIPPFILQLSNSEVVVLEFVRSGDGVDNATLGTYNPQMLYHIPDSGSLLQSSPALVMLSATSCHLINAFVALISKPFLVAHFLSVTYPVQTANLVADYSSLSEASR